VSPDPTEIGDGIPSDLASAAPRPGGLLGNASALLAGRLAIAAMGWAGTVFIVRTLTTDEFGRFSFVFGLLGMMSIITELGMGRVAIGGVLNESHDRAAFAGTYIVLRTVLGGVGYLAALAFVIVAGYPQEVVGATALAGMVLLVATPSHAYDVAFQAHLRMGRVALAGVIGQAAQLALTVAVATAGGDLLWFIVPAIVGEVVILAVKLPQARQLVPFHYTIQPRAWAALMREAVPLSIGGAFETIYYRIDTVLLSKLDTFAAVGTYGVAYKFADLARFVATALTVPILTLLVRAWPDDPAAFRETIRRGAGYLAFFAGLLVVEFGLFAEPLIALLYGKDYRDAELATQLLVASAALTFFSRLAFNALIAAERRSVYPLIALTGLVVNVALNLVLIPSLSFEGSGIATLATEVLVVSLLWFHLSRVPGLRPMELGFLVRGVVPVAAGLAVGAGTGVVVPWVIAAILAALAYTAAAHVARATGPGGLVALLDERRAS